MNYSVKFSHKGENIPSYRIEHILETSFRIITTTIIEAVKTPKKKFMFSSFDHPYPKLEKQETPVFFGARTYVSKYGDPWGGVIGYYRKWGNGTRMLENHVMFELTPIIDLHGGR